MMGFKQRFDELDRISTRLREIELRLNELVILIGPLQKEVYDLYGEANSLRREEIRILLNREA